MTQRYFGLNRGQNAKKDEPTLGTSTGSTDMELRVDDTKLINKKELRILMERIIDYIEERDLTISPTS